MITTDDRFDSSPSDWDDEHTHNMLAPMSDSGRYTAAFDAVSKVHCAVQLWEHDNPGALAAFHAWAHVQSPPLRVTARSYRGSTQATAYEVDRYPITVYVRELT